MVRETPMGRLVVAASGNGVCYAGFHEEGEDPAVVVTSEFPAAVVERESGSSKSKLSGWLDQIVAYLGNGGPMPDAPLDVHGTPFQQEVWEYLRSTSRGTALTYGELAAAIGRPNAVRAVGTACGANHIAVLIPCHRAVRRDGSLGGYRWGLERKRSLLKAESR